MVESPPQGEVTITTDDIRRIARGLLDEAGANYAPVSLRDVVSALNLSLIHATREPFASEAALVARGDSHAIVLRGHSGERRRRFTIAHEIGHFLLHPGLVSPQRSGPVNAEMQRLEREADAFAAELLMPEHLLRQAVYEMGADAGRLADRFEVSEAAMRVRLRRLGLAERQSDLLPPANDLL